MSLFFSRVMLRLFFSLLPNQGIKFYTFYFLTKLDYLLNDDDDDDNKDNKKNHSKYICLPVNFATPLLPTPSQTPRSKSRELISQSPILCKETWQSNIQELFYTTAKISHAHTLYIVHYTLHSRKILAHQEQSLYLFYKTTSSSSSSSSASNKK
jgi:hypothetical protein